MKYILLFVILLFLFIFVNMSQGMIRNRKAKRNYVFLESYVAGIKLVGSEIKSIRNGDVNINDAYCYIENNEVFIKNMYIKEYEKSSHFNHEPRRDRKLLLSKQEIRKIGKMVKPGNVGMTIVPISLFINDRGWAKINISVSKGKKDYDKRESLKAKDIDMNTKRTLKNYK